MHPYTEALLKAMPELGAERLEAISGQPPDLADLPEGCAFGPRCKSRFERCRKEPDLLWNPDGHGSACWLAEQGSGDSVASGEKSEGS
jgi:oligopeptide/dipeptide ABC transporter ATP-binding protein